MVLLCADCISSHLLRAAPLSACIYTCVALSFSFITPLIAAVSANLGKDRMGLTLVVPAAAAPVKVRLSSDKKTLNAAFADNKLNDIETYSNVQLEVKDYGVQFSYKGVFLIEYFGPFAIMLLFFLRPAFIYGASSGKAAWDSVAHTAALFWMAHYLKREFETLFIHKFSRSTMPISNLWRNSIYYWMFAAAVAYPLCHPAYTAPKNDLQVKIGAALFVAAELTNFAVHYHLSTLRPASGSDKREPPKGILFSLVTSPNYTAEVSSHLTRLCSCFYCSLE
jgi:hypothetical protein